MESGRKCFALFMETECWFTEFLDATSPLFLFSNPNKKNPTREKGFLKVECSLVQKAPSQFWWVCAPVSAATRTQLTAEGANLCFWLSARGGTTVSAAATCTTARKRVASTWTWQTLPACACGAQKHALTPSLLFRRRCALQVPLSNAWLALVRQNAIHFFMFIKLN